MEQEHTKKYRQERRALLWGIQHSDGEYVKIPLSVAQVIRKDLEALNSIRQAVHKLER